MADQERRASAGTVSVQDFVTQSLAAKKFIQGTGFPADYPYFPVLSSTNGVMQRHAVGDTLSDMNNVPVVSVIGVRDDQGQVTRYSAWLERGKNGDFDKVSLLSEDDVNKMYYALPGAEVGSDEARQKMNIGPFMRQAINSAYVQGRSSVKPSVILDLADIQNNPKISFYGEGYKPSIRAEAGVVEPLDKPEAISREALIAKLKSIPDHQGQKDPSTNAAAMGAILQLNAAFRSDKLADKPETRNMVVKAIEDNPAHASTIAAFALDQIADGRANAQVYTQKIALSALPSAQDPRLEAFNRVSNPDGLRRNAQAPAEPKVGGIRDITSFVPEKGKGPEHEEAMFQKAHGVLDAIKFHYMGGADAANGFDNEHQMSVVIAAWRKGEYRDYAHAMQDLKTDLSRGRDLDESFSKADRTIAQAYEGRYSSVSAAQDVAQAEQPGGKIYRHGGGDDEVMRKFMEGMGVDPNSEEGRAARQEAERAMEGMKKEGADSRSPSVDPKVKGEICESLEQSGVPKNMFPPMCR